MSDVERNALYIVTEVSDAKKRIMDELIAAIYCECPNIKFADLARELLTHDWHA